MMRQSLAVIVSLLIGGPVQASGYAGLDETLGHLERDGRYSGAVVIRDAKGIRFARGYGPADPFTNRRFTPDTPVDSASIAKPITNAAILLLAQKGLIDLEAPVRRYLPAYPHGETQVYHLLAHSAGIGLDESSDGLAGKSNMDLLIESARTPPAFPPGTAFAYCNMCSITLALLIERVTGRHYLDFARRHLYLPGGVAIRPSRLSDWKGRAIGYKRGADGKPVRFDSWEGEEFYGAANLSISANQLAQWGSLWWTGQFSLIREQAKAPAIIAGRASALSQGNWYCARDRRRCHYLGHHEGFHHLLYWNLDRRISVVMVSNNGLAPAFQQRLQRALVKFAEGRQAAGRREIAQLMPDEPVPTGEFRMPDGELVTIRSRDGAFTVGRGGLAYRAFLVGNGLRYAPGLDGYLAGAPGGGLRWLSLYEDKKAVPAGPQVTAGSAI